MAIAVAIGLIVWLVVGRGGSNDKSASSKANSTTPSAAAAYVGPVVEPQNAIAAYSKAIGAPIYWAGPQKGYTYELTRTADGKAYVRYLPTGVKVVWAVAGKDYICLEPWTAPGNALNTREHLSELAAGATHDSFVELEWISGA